MLSYTMYMHGDASVTVSANSQSDLIATARIIWDSFEPEVWLSARP